MRVLSWSSLCNPTLALLREWGLWIGCRYSFSLFLFFESTRAQELFCAVSSDVADAFAGGVRQVTFINAAAKKPATNLPTWENVSCRKRGLSLCCCLVWGEQRRVTPAALALFFSPRRCPKAWAQRSLHIHSPVLGPSVPIKGNLYCGVLASYNDVISTLCQLFVFDPFLLFEHDNAPVQKAP